MNFPGPLPVGIVQTAKQQSWSKTRTQRVSVAIATVLGLLAGHARHDRRAPRQHDPDRFLDPPPVAAVAMLGRGLHKAIGYAVPDGADELPAASGDVHVVVNATEDPEAIARAINAQAQGRRADRDGVPDGRDTPADG